MFKKYYMAKFSYKDGTSWRVYRVGIFGNLIDMLNNTLIELEKSGKTDIVLEELKRI